MEILLFMCLGLFLFMMNKTRRNAIIARAKVYDDLNEINQAVFALFLRSFEEDGARPPTRHINFFPVDIEGIPYEDELSAKIWRFARIPLLKVEDPRGTDLESGVSKLPLSKVDDQWKEEVRNLMRLAQVIVIKPALTPGVDWELEQVIQEKLLDKTIIMMEFGLNEPKEVEKVRKRRFVEHISTKFDYHPEKILKAKFLSFDGNMIITHQNLERCNPVKNLERRIEEIQKRDDETLYSYITEQSIQLIEDKLLSAYELDERGYVVDFDWELAKLR